jgi:hypothetical protein
MDMSQAGSGLMNGCSDHSLANMPCLIPINVLMTWQPYPLYSVMFGQLHEGLVAVPDHFWSDLVVAQGFTTQKVEVTPFCKHQF